MATSEAVPLVKVKTTVRVLPSITVRFASVDHNGHAVSPAHRRKKESCKGDQRADKEMLFFHEHPPRPK